MLPRPFTSTVALSMLLCSSLFVLQVASQSSDVADEPPVVPTTIAPHPVDPATLKIVGGLWMKDPEKLKQLIKDEDHCVGVMFDADIFSVDSECIKAINLDHLQVLQFDTPTSSPTTRHLSPDCWPLEFKSTNSKMMTFLRLVPLTSTWMIVFYIVLGLILTFGLAYLIYYLWSEDYCASWYGSVRDWCTRRRGVVNVNANA